MIEIRSLNNSDISDATDCVVRNFARREPMTKLLGISEKECRDFFSQITLKAANEKLSLVARNRQTGQLMGCLIADDPGYISDSPNEDSKSSKFDAIFAILDKVTEPLKTSNGIPKNTYYHVFMLAVEETFRNQRVGELLLLASLKLGKEKGFKFAIAESTGPGSARLRPEHANTPNFVEYRTFQYKGEYPFKELEGGVALFVHDLKKAKL
jgi:ribosomal protein S18 acetylase RimI-like enzyme